MTLRCPACGKTNENTESNACARCGCDLAMLRAVVEAASHRLALAAACLRAGNWSGALDEAQASWSFLHSQESARLAALATIGLGEPATIAHWTSRAAEPASTD